MTFHKNKESLVSPINILNEPLQSVTSLKLLGVYFSTNLNSSNHGQYILKKCCAAMAALYKLYCSGIEGVFLWRAYLALVFSHMAYCWPVICDLPNNLLIKFENFEKRASKLSGLKYDHGACCRRLDKICIKLMSKISVQPDHPLRSCFTVRSAPAVNLRTHAALVPVNKSSRLLKSFAKFYH